MAIKKLYVIICFISVAALLSGCVIGDFVNKVDRLIEIVSNETEQQAPVEEDAVSSIDEQDYYSEYAILPYYKQEVCFTGEQYHEKDDICTLPVMCQSSDECVEWGNQLVHEIEQQFGGFQEFYGFYDYYDEAYDEQLTNDDHMAAEREPNSHVEHQANYNEDIVATYKIEDFELVIPSDSNDESYHEYFWSEFKWIIPSEELWMLESFIVFNDDELVSYVVQEKDNLERWNLAINLNPNIRYHDSISTHVHEFAHLLFLNSTQINPHKLSLTCYADIYIEGKGCPYSHSYIVEFADRFGIEYDEEYEEGKYVSQYASSSLLEDMAETFYMFALTKKPAGQTIAEQKVLFFYEYEELVYLRADILSRVATYMYRVL